MMAILKGYDTRLDDVAYSMGASRLAEIRFVTLPLIAPALLAAFLFAFIISFDELTLALFPSGGLFTTLPKKMWDDAVLPVRPTITAVSTVLLVFVTALILFAEYRRSRGVRR